MEVSKDRKHSMAKFWDKMGQMYGAGFVKQYGEVGGEAFKTWSLGLNDLADDDLRRGFLCLRTREKDFPPNLNEFRRLCKPCAEDMQLLSESKAYQQAVNWRHMRQEDRRPEVYACILLMDYWEFTQINAEKARKKFDAAYAEVLIYVSGGGELREVPLAIEEKKGEKSSEETKAAAMVNLKSMF